MSKLKKEGRNNTVILLTLADMFTWGPFLIISALSGIYLSQKLGVEAIKFVGIGTSIYFFTRSLFQIPTGTNSKNKLKNVVMRRSHDIWVKGVW